MSLSMQSLVGQTVLGEYRLERLLREDGALALFEATSAVDQGGYSVLIAPRVNIETTATSIEAAVDRASRNTVGVKGVVSLLRGSALTGGEQSLLVVVRRGGADPAPLPERLPIPEAVRLLEPLAEALATLHELGLVHGALCPLTVGRRNGELVLDFFGLGAAAEAASGARGARDLLAPAYQLPELRGDRPSSPGPWTDIAALGVLALELITGSRGLLAEQQSLPPLESFGLVVSSQVSDLFERTLSATPRQRPLDPRVFLRELLAGANAPVAPPSARASAPQEQVSGGGSKASGPAEVAAPPAAVPSARKTEPVIELPDVEAIQEARQRRLLGALVGLGVLLLLGGTGVATALVMHDGALPGLPSSSASAPVALPPLSGSPPTNHEPDFAMPAARSHGALTYPADTTALLPVPADAAAWGDRDALVTLVIFGDLTCPFTAHALAALPAIASRFGEELRIVFKFYPMPGNPDASRAALAGALTWGAGGSEIFWKFTRTVSRSRQKLDEASLEQMGVEAGLGAGTLAGKWSGAAPPILAADLELGRRLGVRGTPVFFVNGRRMDGLQPSARLIKVIEHEIRRTKALLADGKARDQLYALRVTSNVTTSEGERLSP